METLHRSFIILFFVSILLSPSVLSIYTSAYPSTYSHTHLCSYTYVDIDKNIHKHVFKCRSNNSIAYTSMKLELGPMNYSIIEFSPDNRTITVNHRLIYDLPENIRNAIVKAPIWMQRLLAYQFKHIDNPDIYADIILESNKKITDEIAFSIAYSPLGEIPPVEVLKENAEKLYEIDKYIQYSDIIDFDDHHGNYGSTIEYKVLVNNSVETRILPPEIYYWYVVHPKLLGESVRQIYNLSWRSYLFYHNDLRYPLLKEKIRGIPFLWDEKSYIQYANRIWQKCIEKHPTAVEAVSYWIGKTIPFQAVGDRPNQPNIIAHEHNGWCGEIQRLAVAALRTVLVPSIGVCNIAEDHVWRAFYDEGWHQNDNWWTDSGGTVDIPMVYAKIWGKHMSSVYTWRGDSIISDVTSTYIPSDDRVRIVFDIKDLGLHPRDGILVTVLVKGILDTTWYKNKAEEIIGNIWDRIPKLFKGKILEKINETIIKKIEEIPESVNFPLISIWNYTDANGRCIFNLGKNHEYIFLIQNPDNFIPFSIRFLSKPENKTFNILLPEISREYKGSKTASIPGNYEFKLSLETQGFQFQRNLKTMEIGRREYNNGKVEWFIVDENNLDRFKTGKRFEYIKHGISSIDTTNFSGDKKNWYIILYNPYYYTHLFINITAMIISDNDENYISLVEPISNLFDQPVFNIGDTIIIRGISSDNTSLNIDNKIINLSSKNWEYKWNTSGLKPGEYTIKAICKDIIDEKTVILVDNTPPRINIEKPKPYQIVKDNLIIKGETWDESGIDHTDINIDNLIHKTSLENWTINFNLDNIKPGIYIINISTVDKSGNIYNKSIPIVINDTENHRKPTINNISYTPLRPDNRSIITVYANITSDMYTIKKVLIHWIYNSTKRIDEMERYGDNPPQNRHPEDPFKNQSNEPLYGYELGVFKKGETIEYWIEAFDYAMNRAASDRQVITIQ